MSQFFIDNVNIYNSDEKEFFFGGIMANDGIISDIYVRGEEKNGFDYLIPGLVDVHTHGRSGYDFTGAEKEELDKLRLSYAECGTTTVFPSLATSSYEDWISSIDNIKSSGMYYRSGANFLGIHLEGRYLSILRPGAHNVSLLAPLDPYEIEKLCMRMYPYNIHITAAYELDGGFEFICAAKKYGATLGLGHSGASYEEALRALGWGVTSLTHTFNAMNPLHSRAPGAVTAAILSDAYAEFICDGVHISPHVIDLVWRAKDHNKFVLITDSMMAAGFGEGELSIAGSKITVKNGVGMTPEGIIAGSTLDLFRALSNLISFTGATFEEAVYCATKAPAEMVKIYDKVGSVESGKRADFCLAACFDKNFGDINLKQTYISGIPVI